MQKSGPYSRVRVGVQSWLYVYGCTGVMGLGLGFARVCGDGMVFPRCTAMTSKQCDCPFPPFGCDTWKTSAGISAALCSALAFSLCFCCSHTSNHLVQIKYFSIRKLRMTLGEHDRVVVSIVLSQQEGPSV